VILVVGNEKGGVGKSTLATNIAVYRAQAGRDVLLVDVDTQPSARSFAALRAEEIELPQISCVSITGRAVAAEIRKLAPKYADIILDAGGRDSDGLRSALIVADALLLPFMPGQYDLWAMENMHSIIEQSWIPNPGLKAYAVVNGDDTNPQIQETKAAKEFLREFPNFNLLDITISRRMAYRRTAQTGRTVNELPRRDTRAMAEMSLLVKQVMGGFDERQ